MSTIEDRIRQLTEDTWGVSRIIILDEINGQCDKKQAVERRKALLDRVYAFLETEQPVFSKLYGVHLSDSCCDEGALLARDQANEHSVEGFRLGFAILERIDPVQMSDEEKGSYLFEAVARCLDKGSKIEDKALFDTICQIALNCPIANIGTVTEDIERLRRKAAGKTSILDTDCVEETVLTPPQPECSGNVPPTIAMDTPVPLDDFGMYEGMHDALGVHDRRLVAADIDQITEMNLSGYKIQSIDSMQVFPILTSLNLADNSIRDVSPLVYLTRLESLNLHGNRLSDVSSLSKMTSVTCLDLSDNRIYDVKPLSKLVGLRHLDLRHNHLRMTNNLRYLVNLEYLDVSGNPVMEYSGLLSMTSLKLVRINDDPINEWVLNKLYDRGVKVEFVGEA